MSYAQTSRVREFIPGYIPHSDFLVQNPVIEIAEDDRIQILRDVEEDRRRWGATTVRPPQFDPRRYVSYQVFENVNVYQRIPAEQIRTLPGTRYY
jgi:hypothetical protein